MHTKCLFVMLLTSIVGTTVTVQPSLQKTGCCVNINQNVILANPNLKQFRDNILFHFCKMLILNLVQVSY